MYIMHECCLSGANYACHDKFGLGANRLLFKGHYMYYIIKKFIQRLQAKYK